MIKNYNLKKVLSDDVDLVTIENYYDCLKEAVNDYRLDPDKDILGDIRTIESNIKKFERDLVSKLFPGISIRSSDMYLNISDRTIFVNASESLKLFDELLLLHKFERNLV